MEKKIRMRNQKTSEIEPNVWIPFYKRLGYSNAWSRYNAWTTYNYELICEQPVSRINAIGQQGGSPHDATNQTWGLPVQFYPEEKGVRHQHLQGKDSPEEKRRRATCTLSRRGQEQDPKGKQKLCPGSLHPQERTRGLGNLIPSLDWYIKRPHKSPGTPAMGLGAGD